VTTPRFRTFDDFQAHLDALGMFHMDLGLGRMERALARLGLDAPFCASVQVVGTNAKGSTSTLLAAVLTAQARPSMRKRIDCPTWPCRTT